MNTSNLAPFGLPRKGLMRDARPQSEQGHSRGSIHPQGDTPGVADVMRAQALLLGHLYHTKHPITRAQHRAIVQDMIDWAQAMDAKERAVSALAGHLAEAQRAVTETKRKLAAARHRSVCVASRKRVAEQRRNENPAVVAMERRDAA